MSGLFAALIYVTWWLCKELLNDATMSIKRII